MVLHDVLPTGIGGLAIAELLAAFMSTFSSTLNSGASFAVRHIWQLCFSPDARANRLFASATWRRS